MQVGQVKPVSHQWYSFTTHTIILYSISHGIQYFYSLLISRSVLIKTAVNKYIIQLASLTNTIKWLLPVGKISVTPLPFPCPAPPCLDFFWNHNLINAMGQAFKCTFKLQLISYMCQVSQYLSQKNLIIMTAFFFCFKDQSELWGRP